MGIGLGVFYFKVITGTIRLKMLAKGEEGRRKGKKAKDSSMGNT
jgi:hypothetical protein